VKTAISARLRRWQKLVEDTVYIGMAASAGKDLGTSLPVMHTGKPGVRDLQRNQDPKIAGWFKF
jgi:hypothetical protein